MSAEDEEFITHPGCRKMAGVFLLTPAIPVHDAGCLCYNPNMSPIKIDKEIMHGTPCFAGTRVPVKTLFDFLEAGDSLDEFLRQFPTVPRELAVEVLEMARQKVISGAA